MSLIPKLQTVFSMVFVLTIGAIGVIAQTPAAPDTSSIKPVADAVSTNELTNENKKPAIAPAGNNSPDKISAVSPHVGNPNSLEFAGAPTATATTLSDTPVNVANNGASIVTRSLQAADADKWELQLSPYFWLASLHGTDGVGNRTTQVDESFGDIFGTLDFALMGVFEARKGRWVVLTDMEYVAISDDKATPGPFFSSVEAEFKTFIFDPEVGYRVFSNPEKGQSIDVLGGIRVWHASTELNFGAGILPATQLQGSRTWVDGIAGLRGKAALSPKLFVTGKFDLGGGGSDFTWQLFAGGGYNVNPKIALIFGYRVLDVNYNKNSFIYDMNQRGPIMGLGFKF